MRLQGPSLASLSGLRIRRGEVSCGVDRRCGLDLVLLWLWCRPAVAAPIQPLTWEPPCAVDEALKSKKMGGGALILFPLFCCLWVQFIVEIEPFVEHSWCTHCVRKLDPELLK